MNEEYINNGGGIGHELITPEMFLIGGLVLIVGAFVVRTIQGRPGLWSDEKEYALCMGAVLFLSTLWHFWFGEASVYAYVEEGCESFGCLFSINSGEYAYLTEDSTRDLGWDGALINSYEITVVATFLIFGVLIPSIFFPLELETGVAMTNLRLWSLISAFAYALPLLVSALAEPSYFQVLDMVSLFIWFPFVVGLVNWWSE